LVCSRNIKGISMPELSSSRVVHYPPEKIFCAVMDIGSYPQVLSYVRGVEVLRQEGNVTDARVQVGLRLLNFSYDCRITSTPFERIDIKLLSGPFKKLDASWQFKAQGENATLVTYSLDARFSNPMMEMTAGALFASQIHHSIIAFEERLKRA